MSTVSLYLSHILDNHTPTYGNEYTVSITLSESIRSGAVANESLLHTTTHAGTHIDLPFHFYQKGQTIDAYGADFWLFEHTTLIEIVPQNLIIFQEIVDEIESDSLDPATELLMVKTGAESLRDSESYMKENPGFAPELYDYLLDRLPHLRAFGFDTISLSSYHHPEIGRKAHRKFLDPLHPLLIIEDMSLKNVNRHTRFTQIVIAPLRIAHCDGMPCTVIATIEQERP